MKSFMRSINTGLIIRIIGFLLIIEGLFMLTALPFTYIFCESDCISIPLSALITIVIGTIAWLSNRKSSKLVGKREGYIIVTFSWLIISLFGSLPFIISGEVPRFVDAFFETMSGFTTTGATILEDIETLPKDLLYWRSLTHWLGGMGVIVLSVAILPLLGIGGMQLFMAEMSGITYDKLHPRITATAKRLWGIYVILTGMLTGALYLGEMDFFDAINHAFSTMATGGFSTRNASIAAFGPTTHYLITLFMILAGTNFTLHYFAMHGQLKKVARNEEFKSYLVIIVVLSFIIAAGLIINKHYSLEQSFRESLFTVVSILTTTGFVTGNYLAWPGVLWMLLFIVMFVGGCAGSTGGGMKVIRQVMLIKNSWLELRRAIHPNAILPLKYNGKSVTDDIIYKVMAFFLMYILIFGLSTIIISFMGYDFETSIGASIASLGNIGPGIGSVGPVDNYAFFSDITKWFLSFLMLIGRLELFTVLILFSPYFWRK